MPHVNLDATVQAENARLLPQTFGKQYCDLSQKHFRERENLLPPWGTLSPTSAAFHHRFHRFQKIEHARREMFQSVSENLDLGLIEGALDTEWVSELERAITIRQITSRMDGWTRKVWRARQLGYTWKEISSWLGVTEQQAKMKFQYGLEKTRHSIVRVLKAGKPKELGEVHRIYFLAERR